MENRSDKLCVKTRSIARESKAPFRLLRKRLPDNNHLSESVAVATAKARGEADIRRAFGRAMIRGAKNRSRRLRRS
jgi:hypothetical protein